MDYKKMIFFCVTNFVAFSTLIMVILLIIIQRKKSGPEEVTEKTERRDLNPDHIKTVSSSFQTLG